jgi:hypothetical protein
MVTFSRQTLTIHLEEGEARAVVLKGKRVTDWASMPIPPGTISSGLVEDPRALAELLGELLKQVRSKSRRPLVSLGGIHQVVRILNLPRLKRDLLIEAINGEMRRELASPIEEYQIHWVPIESSKTHVRVYVLAVPANELESYMAAFNLARLKPRRTNLEAMALASMLDGEDAVIIGIRDKGFSIVVAKDGIPAALRDISYSQENLSSADRVADLAREVQLTLASFGSNQEDAPAESPLTTYLVGKHTSDNYLTEYLSQEIGVTAKKLDLPAVYPEDFPLVEYAANVGLALNMQSHRSLFPTSKADFSFNLAAPEHLQTTVPVVQGALLVLVVVALVGIFNPLREALKVDAEEARLRSQIGQLELRTDEVRDKIRRSRQIEAALAQDEVKPQQLKAGLEEIASQRLRWTLVVSDSQAANPDIELLTFSEDADKLTIAARAPDAHQAVAFSDYLSEIGRFRSVTIQSLTLEAQEAGGQQVLFNLIANKGE